MLRVRISMSCACSIFVFYLPGYQLPTVSSSLKYCFLYNSNYNNKSEGINVAILRIL